MPVPANFRRRQQLAADDLNAAIDSRVQRLVGDGYIEVAQLGKTLATIKLNLQKLIEAMPKGSGIRFGKATAAWESGNTITLDPCAIDGTDNGESNRTVYLILPADYEWLEDSILIEQDDILGYFPFDESGTPKGVLVSPPLKVYDCEAE